MGFPTIHSATTCQPAPTTAASNPQNALGADDIRVAPADPLRAALGLYEVTINGNVQYMTKDEIEMASRQCSAPPQKIDVASELQGKVQVGTAGGFVVAVPAKTIPAGQNAGASAGRSVVTPGSTDVITTAGAMEMANRTGHTVTGLTRGSLAGATEVTLAAHGDQHFVEIGGRDLSPKQLARELYEAGFRGGTLRLAVCESGLGAPNSVAQQLANELAKLGAETTVITPAGNGRVSILSNEHGLPQVRNPPEPLPKAPGKGWEYVTPEVPTRVVPAGLARGAAIAGVGINVLNVITTIKFAWDFKKMMDFGDELRSGRFFQDFWLQVSALPDGSRIELDGEIGTLDLSKGVAIRFENAESKWTIRMTSDPKAGFGMLITGTDHGKYVEYHIDKNGVRGGEVA